MSTISNGAGETGSAPLPTPAPWSPSDLNQLCGHPGLALAVIRALAARAVGLAPTDTQTVQFLRLIASAARPIIAADALDDPAGAVVRRGMSAMLAQLAGPQAEQEPSIGH